MMPFLPDQQLALVFAQKMIQDNRKFLKGTYRLGITPWVRLHFLSLKVIPMWLLWSSLQEP